MSGKENLVETIIAGREEGGFSDSEIKDYLIRKKYKFGCPHLPNMEPKIVKF